MTAGIVVELLLFAGLGLGVGWLHFRALWWNVEALARPRPARAAPWLPPLRLAATVAAFALVARAGAGPLLAAVAGFTLARPLAVRQVAGPTREVAP